MPPDPETTHQLVQWQQRQRALPLTERDAYAKVKHMLVILSMRGQELRARQKLVPRGEVFTWLASQLERVETNIRSGDCSPFGGCSPCGTFDERISAIKSLVQEAVGDILDASLRLAAERFNQQLEAWKEASRCRKRAGAQAEALRLLADFSSCCEAFQAELARPDIH